MTETRPRYVVVAATVGAWSDELHGLLVRVLLETTHATTGDPQTLDCLLPIDQAKEMANQLLESVEKARENARPAE